MSKLFVLNSCGITLFKGEKKIGEGFPMFWGLCNLTRCESWIVAELTYYLQKIVNRLLKGKITEKEFHNFFGMED